VANAEALRSVPLGLNELLRLSGNGKAAEPALAADPIRHGTEREHVHVVHSHEQAKRDDNLDGFLEHSLSRLRNSLA